MRSATLGSTLVRLAALLVASLVAAGLGSGPAGAEPPAETASAGSGAWKVGAEVEPLALEDQHGTIRRVDASTRVVLFSRDMEGGEILKTALAAAPEGFLEAEDAAYVADVHRMPAIVTRLFALPSLRERPYPMLLDREGPATAPLPDAEGRATLVFLEGLRVTRILYAGTPAEVARALHLPAPDTGAPGAGGE